MQEPLPINFCRCALGQLDALVRAPRQMMRKRGWARTTFYRSVDTGAGRIVAYLNARGVTVR